MSYNSHEICVLKITLKTIEEHGAQHDGMYSCVELSDLLSEISYSYT